MIVFAWLAATIIAATTVAVAMIARNTTVSIIVRKDPDMATLKERLAALEAQSGDVASLRGEIAALATKDDVAAVATRVDVIETEIGTDPVEQAPASVPTFQVEGA